MRVSLLKEVLKGIFSKPVTIEYPKVRTQVEVDARGRHYADLNKCIGCSLCAIECPANAIVMEKIPEGYEVPKTNARRIYPVVDYFKCVYCYRCVTVCPTKAYITTSEYRLATSAKAESRVLSLNTIAKAEVKPVG
ncbi:MAG: NADH-quinone oxidoreductase subunit I [Zestosphaera tikiterensis]|uniref:NADH-quinone oxidoreductase subunit I n=1 Tax=Zestosphaera tikiterensis TaxID=1973259 RepID=A0A2R7Y8K2_9CREN|nr:MAG: NADH-quinone oxidoreductase subunit I [Zestosphaera tikiterensis]